MEGVQRESVVPDAEESRHFWSDIWDQAVTHIENTDWLRRLENELGELTVQDEIHIEIKKVRKQIRKCRTGKAQDLVVCRDTGSKISATCTTV